MKKKNLVTICIILAISIICIIILINKNFYKIHKANLIFNNDLCNKNENDHPSLGLTVISSYKCEICGKEKQYGSSPTPIICEECSKSTNRCQWCGKLERITEKDFKREMEIIEKK